MGVADDAKPQSQYSADVSGIAAGDTWTITIELSKLWSSHGLDLSTLATGNLVVRADSKNQVEESNENDNIYDVNQ